MAVSALVERKAPGHCSFAPTGRVWSTDKDGLILGLLAAEIIAKTGRDPAEHHRALTNEFGEMVYERTDMPATPEEKAALVNPPLPRKFATRR